MRNPLRSQALFLAALALTVLVAAGNVPSSAQEWSQKLTALESRVNKERKTPAATPPESAADRQFHSFMSDVYADKKVSPKKIDWAVSWLDALFTNERWATLSGALAEPAWLKPLPQWNVSSSAMPIARQEYSAAVEIHGDLAWPSGPMGTPDKDFILKGDLTALEDSLYGYAPDGAQAPIVEITAQNYQTLVLNSKLPVFLDYSAKWCVFCRLTAPVIKHLAREYRGRVVFGGVDVDAQPALGSHIKYLPTFILMRGGKETSQISTQASDADLASFNKRMDGLIREHLIAQ